MSARPTVLFIGEAAALAHVSRPAVLAQALDPDRYDVHVACDPMYVRLLGLPASIRYWPLPCRSATRFAARASRGDFAWQPADLEAYVQDEFALFDRIRPAFIVSDFRFSVSVSAEIARIPYAALTNAHWSPYRHLAFSSTPPWPRLAKWRRTIAATLMPRRVGATAALNRVRAAHGLAPLRDWLDVSARGTLTWYADPEGFVDLTGAPSTHTCLGAVLWSPPVARPAWWERWDPARPLVYVTLGSTGAAARLPAIVRALDRLPVTIVVATAGRMSIERLAGRAYAAPYLPGLDVCRHASAVVCSGGSATAYQALAHGVPVVGLWSNLDQYLTMMTIVDAGAGLCDHASSRAVGSLVSRILDEPGYARAARTLAATFAACDARQRFQSIIERIPEIDGNGSRI